MLRPIFVGGAGRSGTTLLRVMLNAHPNLCSGPEFKFTPVVANLYDQFRSASAVMEAYHLTSADIDRQFADFIEGFFTKFIKQSGAKRLVEKTPHNVLAMPQLGSIFPQAKFIHVLRDGRDVSSSLVTMNWTDMNGQPLWYTQDIHKAAMYWRQVVEKVHQDSLLPHLNGRVLEVRYEELIEDPQETLKGVLHFLDEPWDEEVLHYYEHQRSNEPVESSSNQVNKKLYSDSIERWKSKFSSVEKKQFMDAAGELLVQLGYSSSYDW